jgi:hypothetical protein
MSDTCRGLAAAHRLFSAGIRFPDWAANQLDKRADANKGRSIQKLDVGKGRTKDAAFGPAHKMGLLGNEDSLKLDLIDHPFLL